MRHRTFIPALLLALPLAAPALHAQAASKPAAGSSLAAMDTDHDGKVSRAEFDAMVKASASGGSTSSGKTSSGSKTSSKPSTSSK